MWDSAINTEERATEEAYSFKPSSRANYTLVLVTSFPLIPNKQSKRQLHTLAQNKTCFSVPEQ